MKPKSENIKQELIANLLETRAAILHEATQLFSENQFAVFLGVWLVVDLIARG